MNIAVFMRLDRLRQDLRFALRSLSRDRSFTLIALTTLALGITATVTSFAVTKSVLLNPLAFPDPDRLAMVWEHSPSGNVRNLTSAYNYIRWRDRAQSFESIGAIAQGPVNVSGLGEADQVDGVSVTSGFFDALGIQFRRHDHRRRGTGNAGPSAPRDTRRSAGRSPLRVVGVRPVPGSIAPARSQSPTMSAKCVSLHQRASM